MNHIPAQRNADALTLTRPQPRWRRTPAHPPELLRLFHAVEALRAEDRPLILQFVAVAAGDGATTIARGLARVAGAETGRPTMMIDAASARDAALDRGRGAPSLASRLRQAISLRGERDDDLVEAVLQDGAREAPLSVSETRCLFYALAEQFHTVVLDCGALASRPHALGLARHCDGTVLVVRAETTREDQVAFAKQSIERVGGHVIGAVLNRAVEYLPAWLAARV